MLGRNIVNRSLTFALFAACAVFPACTGTSSETPWPAEPADVDLGPGAEEERANQDASSRPAPAEQTPVRMKAKASSSASAPLNVRAP